MFIRDRKIYMICLLVSCVGTALFWILGFINNDVVATISTVILVIAAIAGVLCGSLNVYWSLVKSSFKKGNVIIVFLPWLIIYWFFRLIGIAFAIFLGLVFCFTVPGIYALIAWYRYRDQLI